MGLRMAWAGFVQKEADGLERLVPARHAGYERNYLTRFRLKSWERRYPKSLARKVISTGEPVAVQDLETPSVEFFRVEEALRRGYRSVLLLPLKPASDFRGILCLYSAEPGAFGTTEITYFTQVAGELAHGIELLRREASNRRAIPENQE
jgi:GAF domain-containing protein